MAMDTLSAQPVHFNTVDAKTDALQQQQRERKRLGQQIDAMLAKAGGDAERVGCMAAVRRLLFRGRGRSTATTGMASVQSAEAFDGHSSTASATVSIVPNGRHVTRAVFGLPVSASQRAEEARTKLESALVAMRARVDQLETRANESRSEAARLARGNQKAQALRMLKKAKAVEAQLASNQAAVDAVEQQLDTLTQAAMQKTLASALASTSKTFKRDAKALQVAESAIEDAAEARDMATDLNTVVAEFAQNGTAYEDDDELLDELNAMVEQSNDPPPPAAGMAVGMQATDVRDELHDVREAARVLEVQHATYDADDALRQRMPTVPDAKRDKRLERRSLLSDDSARTQYEVSASAAH